MLTLKPSAGDRAAEMLAALETEIQDFRRLVLKEELTQGNAYQSILTECKPVIRAFRVKLYNAKDYSNETLSKLHASMDAFEAELDAGKHDRTREAVAYRLLQLQHRAAHLQDLLKGGKKHSEASVTLSFRLQRLAFKLMLLWLLYRWGRLAWQHNWELQEKHWEENLAALKLRLHDMQEDAEHGWHRIATESAEMMERMRKMFNAVTEKEKT